MQDISELSGPNADELNRRTQFTAPKGRIPESDAK